MLLNLFDNYTIDEYVGMFKKALLSEIDKLEITEATNISALADDLNDCYRIKPIIVGKPEPSEPKEKIKSIKTNRGCRYDQKIHEILVTIPIEGNIQLFKCRPSYYTVVSFDEKVSIGETNVIATIVLEQLNSSVYDSKVNMIIEKLSINLLIINEDIKPWNDGLENLIKDSLEKRKAIVSTKFDFMEKIGLKVNPKSSEYLIPNTITKKIIPTPVTETTKNVDREKIPILQEKVYDDIKEVIYNVGKAIERKPSIYKEKHEEDLRDIFLLFLETRYESATGVGEAFNKKGKTDILLKYYEDGTNLFVAECKFWKGQKSMLKAIDQLLGYLTHRDSKTALIFFVDQKEMTTIVSTIKDTIMKHPNFSRYIKDTYEHSISYEFTLPDDSKRKIQLEIILFHFPKIS